MRLKDYLELLIDEEIDENTGCQVCVFGIADLLEKIFLEIKTNYGGTYFQKFLKKKNLYGIGFRYDNKKKD